MTKTPVKNCAEILLSYHLESAWDLEEIMESLDDFWLLNNWGQEVRKEIWKITTKWKPDTHTYEDMMMSARKSFSKWTQKNLLSEYNNKTMNKRAMNFIKKYILSSS